jgi:hypothetical protein
MMVIALRNDHEKHAASGAGALGHVSEGHGFSHAAFGQQPHGFSRCGSFSLKEKELQGLKPWIS